MIIINRTIDFACCLLAVTAMIITLISCKTTMEQVKPSNAEHTIAEESSMGDDKDALYEAIVLNQQGVKLYKQGHYQEAIQVFLKALAIREKALGPDHPSVATSIENIAVLYRATNRGSEAEELEAEAARI